MTDPELYAEAMALPGGRAPRNRLAEIEARIASAAARRVNGAEMAQLTRLRVSTQRALARMANARVPIESRIEQIARVRDAADVLLGELRRAESRGRE